MAPLCLGVPGPGEGSGQLVGMVRRAQVVPAGREDEVEAGSEAPPQEDVLHGAPGGLVSLQEPNLVHRG